MAETQFKRQREDSKEPQEHEFEQDPKRQKSYNDILSILEEEEDEPHQDLFEIFTSLQKELTSSSDFSTAAAAVDPLKSCGSEAESVGSAPPAAGSCSDESSPTRTNGEDELLLEDDDDERVKMMRHLLEASDDELGIPSNNIEVVNESSGDEEITINGGDSSIFSSLGDGMMWEFEDAAANFHYYTFMQQSELFI